MPIATRTLARWFLIIALLGVAAHQLLDDGVEYRTCEEKLEILESLTPDQLRFATIQGRAEQWLVDHERCPTIGDLAGGETSIGIVCSGRRVVAITSR